MDDKPKLHVVGGDTPPVEEPQETDVVPTVVTHALKVVHPIFTAQDGTPLPPPPDHELRVGIQVSIATKGKVVQEAPGVFFASGDDPEEIADMLRDVILQGLQAVKEAASPIKMANPDFLQKLDKMGEKT